MTADGACSAEIHLGQHHGGNLFTRVAASPRVPGNRQSDTIAKRRLPCFGFGNAPRLIVRRELFRVMDLSHVINAVKAIYVVLKGPLRRAYFASEWTAQQIAEIEIQGDD